MNTIGKYILIVGMLLFCLLGRAYDYVITTPSENGVLFDNYVHCIYEDSDGYIWVGTGSTVERFDGITGQVYKFEEGMPNYAPHLVNTILEKERHEYWVGNVHGLFQLDHHNHIAKRIFRDQINNSVYSLKKDQKNHIYIGTSNGLYIYKDGKLHYITVDNKNIMSEHNRILSIEVTDSNNVWLLTAKGVAVYDIKSGAIKLYQNTLSDCGYFRCFVKAGNHLYIGTEKKGIVTFDLSHYRFLPYWNEVKVPVTALSHEEGLLGIATSGQGISLLSLHNKKQIYAAGCNTNQNRGLLSDNISSILVSKGNVWCGTEYYLGFNYLRSVEKPFRLYKWGNFTSRNLIVRSCYYWNEYMFIVTREGFYFVSEKTGRVQHFGSGKVGCEKLRSNLIFSFYSYQGNILIGTCSGGLAAFNLESNKFVENLLTKTLVSNDIFMFLEDGDGNLWIAASDGLYCYEKKTHEVKEYNVVNSGMPGNIVYSICIDSSKRFWVGTDKGTALLDCKTGKCSQEQLPANFLSNEIIRYINEGKDGSLHFFLLENNRLYVVDKELKKSRLFTEIAPFNMAQDEEEGYWMGCDDGILKSDRNLSHFSLFSVDGLVDVMMGASPGASIGRYKQKQLLVPCMKGLVVVDPESSYYVTPLQVTEMFVNGERYADNYQIKSDTTFVLKEYENNLTFNFTSLEYEKPDLIRYQYKLVGKDSVWNWLRGENEVSFFNLPAGDYVFMVRKALNEDSVCMVTFSIQKSGIWIWLVFLGMICIGMIAGFIYSRQKKVKALDIDSVKEEPVGIQVSNNNVKLNEEEARKVMEALKEYMEKSRPYLNVDLKQSEVAAAIGCSAYILSTVFTHYLKVGYYDFINGYRVEEFKQAIKEGKHQKYTLVTLAEKCGFKSKTSFFRTFKKFTGFTPNEYIQHQDEN